MCFFRSRPRQDKLKLAGNGGIFAPYGSPKALLKRSPKLQYPKPAVGMWCLAGPRGDLYLIRSKRRHCAVALSAHSLLPPLIKKTATSILWRAICTRCKQVRKQASNQACRKTSREVCNEVSKEVSQAASKQVKEQ